MKPTKVSSSRIKELATYANIILSKIDSGANSEDPELKSMMAEWNNQVTCPSEFSDFRDFSSWTSAKEFTRIALNLKSITRTLPDRSWYRSLTSYRRLKGKNPNRILP